MLYALRQVGRSFRSGDADLKVLDDVSLTVAEGSFVAVVGPSGAGKTTLLQVLGLLDDGYRGEVELRGRVVAGLSARQRARLRLAEIGFVFQSFNLLPTLDVRDNVALPHWRLHGSRRVARARAEALVARVGLEHRLGHDVRRLSAGEMQRVAVARALVNDPFVILADEPTGNLDATSARMVLDLLAASRTGGRALVVATHSTDVVAKADDVVMLRYGRVADEVDRPTVSREGR